ncbi:neutral zinc metallopeptidase [Nocardioides salsibiostraticola]
MVRFNPKAKLNTGRVTDAGRGAGRGQSTGGRSRGGLPIPGGSKGGIGTIVVVLIVFAISQFAGVDIPGTGGSPSSGLDATRLNDTGRYSSCQTGADANKSADCARVAVENSLADFWSDELGSDFRVADRLVTFTGSVSTACGAATSEVGPFYCPGDERIYLDSGFFDEVLEKQLGGPDGGFVEAYVLAHEYGHHISNITGQFGKVRTQQGPQSDAVRLELQADCYAGMWARAATRTEDEDGNVLYTELNQEDIDLALQAAASVGDDRIQQKTTGQVREETFSHGSADQRQKWFSVGFDQGSFDACDTFAASKV